ncbi:MAG: Ig-like domain-containing protein [Polyangiaceae bacterium]
MNPRVVTLVSIAALSFSVACSSSKLRSYAENGGNAGSGGEEPDGKGGRSSASSSGGGSSTLGGASGKGGTSSAVGGDTGAGGTSSVATGGTSSVATGGTSSVATGGTSSVATGGTSSIATGGTSSVATGGTSSVATGGTSAGGTTAKGGTTSGSTTPSDTTPPTVVSLTPANGSTGVTSSSKIVISFSEPMDTSAAGNAVSVSSISASDLTLSWSSDKKVLTVTPKNGLAYATGANLAATAAQSYTVKIGTEARDAAGNGLVATYNSAFSTLRRIKQTLTPETVATYDTYAPAVGGNIQTCSGTSTVRLGRWSGSYSSGTYYGYVLYNLAALGSVSVATTVIEEAIFGASQRAPEGAFYPTGSILVDRLTYQAIDKTILQNTPTNLGTLCTSSVSQPTMSVLTAFKSDFAAGNQSLLYRVSPNTTSTLSTYGYLECGGFTLAVTFVAP